MTAQLLLSLSILIAVHEWGHFITARMFDIKVEKFYLFFDFLFPMANVLNFSLFKYKKGDTEYGIGWFPLGGYVKIAGMVDESMDKEQMKLPPQPWEFRAKPAWQRLIVMLGGVVVNVITGIIIFIGLTYFLGDTYIPKDYVNKHGGIQVLSLGKQLGFENGDQIIQINGNDFEKFDDVFNPDMLLTDNASFTVLRNGQNVTIPVPANFVENFNRREAALNFVVPRIAAEVGGIKKGTLADEIGLQPGDRFIEVGGEPVTYFDEISPILKGNVKDTIALKIQRNDEIIAFNKYLPDSTLGFYSKAEIIPKEELIIVNYSLGESIVQGPAKAFGVIALQMKAFKRIFSGDISLRNSLSGPVGMAKAYGGTWDWERFWKMTGLLSMVLAFMNLLPIPALDGGYVMFLLYEMISGREPSEKFFETALKIGMAVLLVLMVFVFYNDIAKLITGG